MKKFSITIISSIIIVSCVSYKKVQFNPDMKIDLDTGNSSIAKFSKKSGLNYIITFPKEYEKQNNRNYPLVVFLHSMAERGTDIELLINNPDGQGNGIIPSALKRNDIISVSVLCPDNTYWSLITNRLHILILEVLENYRINHSKVLLTGVSMGGMGVWSFAMDYPNLFNAIAPISAGVYSPPMKIRTSVLKTMRIWAIHDRYDSEIPLSKERWFIDKLNSEGIPVKYTITEYGKHYIHEEFYESGEIYNWFLRE